MVVWWPPQLAAHWAQTSQLLASGAAVCRSFYDDRERAFAAQSRKPVAVYWDCLSLHHDLPGRAMSLEESALAERGAAAASIVFANAQVHKWFNTRISAASGHAADGARQRTW